jgi:hypothetical protein
MRADIHFFQLFLSGEVISIQRSQSLLSGLFGNVNLEQLFNCGHSNESVGFGDGKAD